MRAALVYHHATTDRDRSIADTLSELVDLGRTNGKATEDEEEDDDDGSTGALVRWRNSTLIARTVTAAPPMIGWAAVLPARWGGAGDGNRTRIASLEEKYSTHRLTCGSLISGSKGFHAVIPRCSPPPPVLSGTDLARGSPKDVNN